MLALTCHMQKLESMVTQYRLQDMPLPLVPLTVPLPMALAALTLPLPLPP